MWEKVEAEKNVKCKEKNLFLKFAERKKVRKNTFEFCKDVYVKKKINAVGMQV